MRHQLDFKLLLLTGVGLVFTSFACKPNRDRDSLVQNSQLAPSGLPEGEELISCTVDHGMDKAQSPTRRLHVMPVGADGKGSPLFQYVYKKEFATDVNKLAQGLQLTQNNSVQVIGKDSFNFIALVAYNDTNENVGRDREKKAYYGPSVNELDGFEINPVNPPYTAADGTFYANGYDTAFRKPIKVYPGSIKNRLINSGNGEYIAQYNASVFPPNFVTKDRSVPMLEAFISTKYTPASNSVGPQPYNYLSGIRVHFENLGEKVFVEYACNPPLMMTTPMATAAVNSAANQQQIPLANKDSNCSNLKPFDMRIVAEDSPLTDDSAAEKVELNKSFWGLDGIKKAFGVNQKRIDVGDEEIPVSFLINEPGVYSVNAYTVGKRRQGSSLSNRLRGPLVVTPKVKFVVNANCEIQPESGSGIFEFDY